MHETAFTLVDEQRPVPTVAHIDGDTVRLSGSALRVALDWELKPEGFCRGQLCIPHQHRAGLVTPDGVDLTGFAALVQRPLAMDVAECAAVLGASAGERGRQLASLEAPDFALPDLAGRVHSLSDYRGKRVLLVAHASW